ncbi:MAG: Flp family type IVb pilin [Pseudomonadota bacterium]
MTDGKPAVARKKSKLESGATAIEYALIASLIAVAIITATTTLGDKVADTFDDVSDQLAS